MFAKVFEHPLTDVIYGAMSNSILQDNKSVSVKLFKTTLDILAAELRDGSLLFRDMKSIDYLTWLSFGDVARDQSLDTREHVV